MRAVFACLAVWAFAVSPAVGQFHFFADNRSVRAFAETGTEQIFADLLTPADMAVTAGAPGRGSSSAWQSSRVSPNEIFVSGGTGDVVWQSPNGNAGASSVAGVTFGVSSPTQVRIRYEVATTSFRSWTAGAGLHIAESGVPIVNIEAVSQSEGMEFYPPGAFEIGADGYARTVFDEFLTFLPSSGYELRTDASSRCPGPTATDSCVGKPINFTTHVQVIPEPATWIMGLLAGIASWCYRRFRS
jgi:hypothetical protein